MWIADGWTDYEILETSAGEKLERWGDYLLVRPDPQVIWLTKRHHSGWKKPHAHYHRSDRGGGEWEVFDLPPEWNVSYKDLVFRLKPMGFKHTGLFPEQAVNWDWCREKIATAQQIMGHPLRILNLFAYTGGASMAAAKAGACVTHVDAAKGMVAWAKENAEASGMRMLPIRWLVDDCLKFVEREFRRGNNYDGIIMDPPSYGKGPKGETWKLAENIYMLLQMTVRLLSDEAVFFLLNSYTTGLQPAALAYMLNSLLVGQRGGQVEAEEIGLPVSGDGLVLPCGAAARWVR
jgi:23S rRNA (cytosine1962-C5)-methyltransferase